MNTTSVARNLLAFARTGRLPARRALAALAKLHGHRLERRWPFLPRDPQAAKLLEYDDLLALQSARTAGPLSVLVVGAYDGMANDPIARYVRTHDCDVTFVEPQADAFELLQANMASLPRARFVNAAIDSRSGTRELFYVPCGIADLPAWAGQLASFDREHILKHESRVPGLSAHVCSRPVRTLTFDALMRECGIARLDVLQIDAEGHDAALLASFPFDRVQPGLVHYEIAHMTAAEREQVHTRLSASGYTVVAAWLDEIAARV
jgi:FkbM family methyltransferase